MRVCRTAASEGVQRTSTIGALLRFVPDPVLGPAPPLWRKRWPVWHIWFDHLHESSYNKISIDQWQATSSTGEAQYSPSIPGGWAFATPKSCCMHSYMIKFYAVANGPQDGVRVHRLARSHGPKSR